MRFSDIRAADIVDEPAATRGGMFDLTTPDLRNLPAQATALLSTYFGDATEDVVRGRIDSFLSRYFSSKKEPAMAAGPQNSDSTDDVDDVDNDEVTPGTGTTETPAADLSASETPIGETTVTADLAGDERIRCKKIRALVDLAGVPAMFNTFIDNDFSVEQTQFALREIVAKKNPSLSAAVEEPAADKDADLKAEYAEMVKFKVTMGQSESDYIAHARQKSA
jgi:hypothetical protein